MPSNHACRTLERTSWRRHHHPTTSVMGERHDIGPELSLAHHSGKGRIVISTSPRSRGGVILEEPAFPLTLYLQGHCHVCAKTFMAAPDALGMCQSLPGARQCGRCNRFFCCTICATCVQHKAECVALATIGSLDGPSVVCPSTMDQETRAHVHFACEAVMRLACLAVHNPKAAEQVRLLDSSYPSKPFGEYSQALAIAFGRLNRACHTTERHLWWLHGVIKTNADLLDKPRPHRDAPKPPPVCLLLRPRISLLAHACNPTCYVDMDVERPAGGSGRLCAFEDIPAGGELTRSYAGCSAESSAAFALEPRHVRQQVLREKGFHFECQCGLCEWQRAKETRDACGLVDAYTSQVTSVR